MNHEIFNFNFNHMLNLKLHLSYHFLLANVKIVDFNNTVVKCSCIERKQQYKNSLLMRNEDTKSHTHTRLVSVQLMT